MQRRKLIAYRRRLLKQMDRALDELNELGNNGFLNEKAGYGYHRGLDDLDVKITSLLGNLNMESRTVRGKTTTIIIKD